MMHEKCGRLFRHTFSIPVATELLGEHRHQRRALQTTKFVVTSDTRSQPQHHHYVCSATCSPSFWQTVTMRGMWCGWTLYITCRSPRDRNCSCSEPGFCSNLSLSELPLASQSRASTKLQSRHAMAPKHFRCVQLAVTH